MGRAEILQRVPEETAPKKQELTLEGIYAGKKLTVEEETAITVLGNRDFDVLNLEQKVAIFNYSLFQELGPSCRIRLKELYGEVREDVVERVVDKIIYNDRLVEKYDDFYKSYEAAIINSDKKATFIMLQKRGHSMQNAAELADLDEKEAKRIRLQAIRAGRLEPSPRGRANAYRFREIRKQAKDLREEIPKQLNAETAKELGTTKPTIRLAIHSLIVAGEIEALTRKDVERIRFPGNEELRQKIEDVIASNPELTDKELAQRFEISIYSFQRHKRRLRREGRIEEHKIKSQNERLKNKLRKVLDMYMIIDPGAPINIEGLARSGDINAPASTLLRLYHELANEKEVPPLRQGLKINT